MSVSDKIPVILVTGFLGSGKTTLLRRLAEGHPDWRLVFLVNEFAETSVDGETLAATGSPTQSVVGGSLFCEWMAALPETILRIKGRLRTPEGYWHVERTVDSLTLDPTNPGPCKLVLIAHEDNEKDLVNS